MSIIWTFKVKFWSIHLKYEIVQYSTWGNHGRMVVHINLQQGNWKAFALKFCTFKRIRSSSFSLFFFPYLFSCVFSRFLWYTKEDMDCSICTSMPVMLRPPMNTICLTCYEGARSVISFINKLHTAQGSPDQKPNLCKASYLVPNFSLSMSLILATLWILYFLSLHWHNYYELHTCMYWLVSKCV